MATHKCGFKPNFLPAYDYINVYDIQRGAIIGEAIDRPIVPSVYTIRQDVDIQRPLLYGEPDLKRTDGFHDVFRSPEHPTEKP